MNGFLQDGSGDKSSMRLVFWAAFLLVGIVWAYCSAFSSDGPKMVDIPRSIVDVLAYLLIGKVGQSTLAENGGVAAFLSAFKKNEQQGS